MPVNTEHTDYTATVDTWKKIRDVLAGEDVVKEAGTRYLPMLEGMDATGTDGAYEAYKERAEFYEAAPRTLEGLVGAVFRRDPVVDTSEAFVPVLDNVTQRGTPFSAFAKQLVAEVIGLGRYGVLVDAPETGGQPYLAGYCPENIINWRVEIVNGAPMLTLVVLREEASEAKVDDPFVTETVERFRVLELIEGVYWQTLYRKVRDQSGREDFVVVGGPTAPARKGQVFGFIPFQFFGPEKLSPDVCRSPILGLVNTNLSHYRTSADLEHGAHFTSLPTAWVAGEVQGEGEQKLRIGSGVAWLLEQGAQVGFLEYTGQGLDALEKRLARKEAHMAVLGARLLEDQKAGVEAARTVEMRHGGENSLLASIADTCSRGLTQVMDWLVYWSGGPEQSVTVELNRDFDTASMSTQELVHLVESWIKGGIGGETLYHNLKAGERLPAEMTYDDFIEDIEQNGPIGRDMFGPMPGEEDPPPDDRSQEAR